MSLIVVPCRRCGETTMPIGGVSADIILASQQHCDACYRSHREARQIHFCSPACLVAYVRESPGELLGEPTPSHANKKG